MEMTLFKTDASRHYFKCGLQKNSKLFIASIAFEVLSIPVLLLSVLLEESSGIAGILSVLLYSFFSFLFAGIAVILGIPIALNSFSYLHKKHESDTYLSFPLSNKQRFFCDYLSGLITYIVPALGSMILSVILSILIHIKEPDEYVFGVGDTDYTIISFVLKIYLFAIICMVMLYTLAVLSAVLCGTLYETLSSTLLINAGIPGMIALITHICFNKAPGVDTGYMMLPVLGKTSPLGAVISFAYYLDEGIKDCLSIPTFLWTLFWLLAVNALYILLSYKLYTKRKAEHTSKPYAFKLYNRILISCLTFAIISIIPAWPGFFAIPVLIFTAVVNLSFETITNRGFKNFSKSIVRCIVTIGVSVIIIFVLNNKWAFGASTRVPDVEDVESVTIDFYGYPAVDGYYYTRTVVEYTSEEGIEIITDIHRDFIENYEYRSGSFEYESQYGYGYYDRYDYTLVYKLKNGLTMKRTFTLSEDTVIGLHALNNTKDFAEYTCDRIIEKYADTNKLVFGVKLKNGYDGYTSFAIEARDGDARYLSEAEYDDFLEELCEAIKTDVDSRNSDDIITEENIYIRINIGGQYAYILKSDVNSIAVLEKYTDI
ncbi:MAG: hypothetical protein IJC65_06130 [Oscillospiraceae bacterium]|nr:hypothetical protein [Oscillospiraceae bacterium]